MKTTWSIYTILAAVALLVTLAVIVHGTARRRQAKPQTPEQKVITWDGKPDRGPERIIVLPDLDTLPAGTTRLIPAEEPSLADRIREIGAQHEAERQDSRKTQQRLVNWLDQIMQQTSKKEVVVFDGPELQPGGGDRTITIHEGKDGRVTLKAQ